MAPPENHDLPLDANASRLAREILAAACKDQNGQWLDEAKLLLTELVVNAVRHAARPLRVSVDFIKPELLRVSVSDGSTGPLQLHPLKVLATGGRGLRLLIALSEDWGVEPSEPGKAVWFTMRVRDAAAAPEQPA